MKSIQLLQIQSQAIIQSELFKVILGVLFIFALAQISIPVEPVPIVLSTVGVKLIGLLYQRRTAIICVISYIFAGLVGLPVLSGFSGGIRHFYGPKAGYIFGFLLAVSIMTYLREVFKFEKSFFGILLIYFIGTLAIYLPGLLWLSIQIGLKNSITFGLMPFIIPGIIKTFIFVAAIKFIRHR